MKNKFCDKPNCLANIKGECCVDECKGELIRLVYPPPKDEATVRKAIYEMSARYFSEDFVDRVDYSDEED